MVNNNTKKGQKQPPKATIDLKAKDVTDTDKTAGTKPSSRIKKIDPDKNSASKATPSSVPKTGNAQNTGKNAASNAKPAEKKAPRPPKQKKSGGGFFSNLISATVGGIIALFGMSYVGGPDKLMKMTGLPLPVQHNNELNTLKQEIAALKRNSSQNELVALKQKITDLETKISQAPVPSASTGTSTEKLAALENKLQEFSKMAQGGGAAAIASAAVVQEQIQQAGVADFKKQVLDLRKQNTTVQEEQAKLHEGMASLSEEQAKLHSDIAKMREDTAKLKNSAAKIASEVAQGPDLTAAMAPLLAKIKDFEKQVASVHTENQKAKSEGRNIALAIELSNLKRVFTRGQPFDMELTRIRSHIPNGINITLLETYATTGLPNINQLGKSLNDQMDDIMASEIDTKTDTALSWKDRLLATAKSAIKIRPSGNAKGNSTAAILARVEYQLTKKKNLQAALEEVKALSAKPANVAKGWVKSAQDKVAGDKLLQQIEDKLMGALRGSKN